MEAVGSYIQTLRDKQSVSRARMAEEIGTTENTLWRIESGRQEPGISLLARILQYVQGSLQEVTNLAAKADATAEDGRRAAERSTLQPIQLTSEQVSQIASLDPETREAVFRIVRQLQQEKESG